MVWWFWCLVLSCLVFTCFSGSVASPRYSLDDYVAGTIRPKQHGPQILIAGMGYGTSQQVDAWTTFERPYSIEKITQELLSAGVAKVRHVFGWPMFIKDKPGYITLLYNDPGRGQDSVTKGLIGNITPLGGKVEWDQLAAHGFTLARAYLATAGMELDELDGPNSPALQLLNSFPGLRYQVFASPNGKALYLNGRPVMHFERTPGGVEYKVTLTEYGKKLESYASLDDLVVTYAIGLHPLDRESKGPKKGRPVATAVINVWPTAVWNFIKSLKLGAEATAKGAKGLMAVPIRELGRQYPTTVSNLVALALVGYNPTLYKQLTGREMPKEMPSAAQIDAMRKAIYAHGIPIKEMVKMFDAQHPQPEDKPKEEGNGEKKGGEKKEGGKQSESKKEGNTESAHGKQGNGTESGAKGQASAKAGNGHGNGAAKASTGGGAKGSGKK